MVINRETISKMNERQFVVLFSLSILSLALSHGLWSDQWAVKIDGGKEVADKVAKDAGFVNLGPVFVYCLNELLMFCIFHRLRMAISISKKFAT